MQENKDTQINLALQYGISSILLLAYFPLPSQTAVPKLE